MGTQMVTPIKDGEYMAIPKGTEYQTLQGKYGSPNAADPKALTARDQVVKVGCAYAIYSNEMIDVDYPVYVCSGPNQGQQIRQQACRKIVGYHLCWADGKYIDSAKATPADAPVRKAPDPAKADVVREPTLRMRMVKGTKWKLTEDAGVYKDVKLPPPAGSTARWVRGLELEYTIPRDSVIEIIKFQNYGPGYCEGIWVHVHWNNKGHLVEFKQLNQKPEQVGEAEVIPVFYIWDTAEQKYYSGYEYSRDGTGPINYADKLSKAKSFKMLNLVRTHALIQSGYYDNLPEGWGQIPDWMQSGKAFDIPDTWEIVKIDKLTKKEIQRYELVDTFKRTWKLRALTVKYGSAVRSVYSALEKKGQLENFSAMLMFSLAKDKNGYFTDDELPQPEKDAIMELLKQFDKKDIKIHKSQAGFAVGTKDADTAMMVRLAYTGELECGLIDFATMGEVVVNGK